METKKIFDDTIWRKRLTFLFSRLKNKLGKVNIFHISEMTQWCNSLNLQKSQSSVLGSNVLWGIKGNL